ncbi:MAG TPA: ferredoxin, partial [Planctomycetota bacterium]|nr:ferredoxin [Planctomycetota bacterium]
MPDKNDRFPENAPGAWYVDRACIDCDLCRTTAPRNFMRSKERYSYVAQQPRTPEELEQCRQAALECPVEAIGQ